MNFSDLYEALHGGDPARGVADRAFAARGPAREVAAIARISYSTERDGVRGVWEHPFEARVSLLESDPAGPASHVRAGRDLVLIGWGIDLVTVGGKRILVPGMAVCATAGGRLRIAWLESARYSLRVDDSAIAVTELGIEG